MAPKKISAMPASLSIMTRLAPLVRLWEPSVSACEDAKGHPRLVVLASWMEARDIHIAKYITNYITNYQTIFPSSKILLISSPMKSVILAERRKSARKALASAVEYIRANSDTVTNGKGPSRVLFHVFSNGGSINLSHLRTAFEETTGTPLPPHIIVFDSCPGLHTYERGRYAFASWAPSGPTRFLVALPLATFLVFLYWLAFNPWGRQDTLARVAAEHNVRERSPHERARSYVYSKEDDMIDWQHIEQHAEDARVQGFHVVKAERFEGSKHCAHMRSDESRYFNVVTETWRSRP
jgi:hypothetical protein